MRKIRIMDSAMARRHNPRPNTTMIRLIDADRYANGDYPSLENEEFFEHIFKYDFDDITPADLEDDSILSFGRTLKLFTPDIAEIIIKDLKGVVFNTDYLVVHCNAGYSRSPAVGAGLNHIFNMGIPDGDYIPFFSKPNMHVYSTLVNVARERFHLDFKSPWLDF